MYVHLIQDLRSSWGLINWQSWLGEDQSLWKIIHFTLYLTLSPIHGCWTTISSIHSLQLGSCGCIVPTTYFGLIEKNISPRKQAKLPPGYINMSDWEGMICQTIFSLHYYSRKACNFLNSPLAHASESFASYFKPPAEFTASMCCCFCKNQKVTLQDEQAGFLTACVPIQTRKPCWWKPILYAS